MVQKVTKPLRVVALGLDALSIIGAFMGATVLRAFHQHIPILGWIPKVFPKRELSWSAADQRLLAISIFFWLIALGSVGAYRSYQGKRFFTIVKLHLRATTLCVLCISVTVLIIKLPLSRLFLGYFITLCLGTLLGKYFAMVLLLRCFRQWGHLTKAILVAGPDEPVHAFVTKMQQEPAYGHGTIRTFTETQAEGLEEAIDLHCLEKAIQGINEVFCVPGRVGITDDLRALMLLALQQGKRVHVVPMLPEVQLFRQEVTEVAGLPVLSIGGPGLDRLQALLKRMLDIVGALCLLVLLAPLLGGLAILVRRASPGPALFIQNRLGQGGRRFRLYKFRTMHVNAEAIVQADQQLYQKYLTCNCKLPEGEDPRLFPGGLLLRKLSLDELPQLLNVLKGDMSLVGPRPLVGPEITKYGDYAPLFFSVKPGLTQYCSALLLHAPNES